MLFFKRFVFVFLAVLCAMPIVAMELLRGEKINEYQEKACSDNNITVIVRSKDDVLVSIRENIALLLPLVARMLDDVNEKDGKKEVTLVEIDGRTLQHIIHILETKYNDVNGNTEEMKNTLSSPSPRECRYYKKNIDQDLYKHLKDAAHHLELNELETFIVKIGYRKEKVSARKRMRPVEPLSVNLANLISNLDLDGPNKRKRGAEGQPVPQQQGHGSPNLVPDDIANPTRWTVREVQDLFNTAVEDPNIPDVIFANYNNIRSRLRYTLPEIANDFPIIVWVAIHGTFGNNTPDFFENGDGDRENQNFRHIKYNAARYSTIKAKNLELFSYQWNGEWRDEGRETAARELHSFLRRTGFCRNAEIVLLGHSHGCNLANYITNLVSPERPIHLLIHFACPRREEAIYQPLHYRTLIYFFSDSDWTTIMGRSKKGKFLRKALRGAVAVGGVAGGSLAFVGGTGLFIAGMIMAAHEQVNSTPDLEEIKKKHRKLSVSERVIMLGGAGIGLGIAGFSATDLINTKQELARGTNEFPTPNGKITVGIRTKINGENPWHGDVPILHPSKMIDAVKFLVEIIQKAQQHYTLNYSTGGTFNLNIDETNQDNPIMLAVRSRHDSARPERYDCLVPGNDRNNILPHIDRLRITQEETEFSNTETQRFLTRYNKNIEN